MALLRKAASVFVDFDSWLDGRQDAVAFCWIAKVLRKMVEFF
jgi:hypothetical protein